MLTGDKSVLVGQGLVGNFYDAFADDNKPHTNMKPLYIKEFIPRVIDYCSKYNYQYNVLTTEQIEFPHPKYKFHAQKLWYLSQYEKYDYFLWIDMDVIVKQSAPEFPFLPGVTAVLDCNRTSILEHNHHVKVPNHEYFNTGVWGIDSQSAKSIWENGVVPLMEGAYKEYEQHGMVDQSLINQWACENKISHNMIGDEWNTLFCSPLWADRNNSHFIHYAGGQGNKYDRVVFDFIGGMI